MKCQLGALIVLAKAKTIRSNRLSCGIVATIASYYSQPSFESDLESLCPDRIE
jgi:hypothetical protein